MEVVAVKYFYKLSHNFCTSGTFVSFNRTLNCRKVRCMNSFKSKLIFHESIFQINLFDLFSLTFTDQWAFAFQTVSRHL